MSKMKGIKVEIGGPDEYLTAQLRNALIDRQTDHEIAVVYASKAGRASLAGADCYLAVVDGVPITPWISHRAMTNFLLAGFLYDEQAAEEVARYEQDKAWQATHRRGDWEL